MWLVIVLPMQFAAHDLRTVSPSVIIGNSGLFPSFCLIWVRSESVCSGIWCIICLFICQKVVRLHIWTCSVSVCRLCLSSTCWCPKVRSVTGKKTRFINGTPQIFSLFRFFFFSFQLCTCKLIDFDFDLDFLWIVCKSRTDLNANCWEGLEEFKRARKTSDTAECIKD